MYPKPYKISKPIKLLYGPAHPRFKTKEQYIRWGEDRYKQIINDIKMAPHKVKEIQLSLSSYMALKLYLISISVFYMELSVTAKLLKFYNIPVTLVPKSDGNQRSKLIHDVGEGIVSWQVLFR
jgi:hypothetical protein